MLTTDALRQKGNENIRSYDSEAEKGHSNSPCSDDEISKPRTRVGPVKKRPQLAIPFSAEQVAVALSMRHRAWSPSPSTELPSGTGIKALPTLKLQHISQRARSPSPMANPLKKPATKPRLSVTDHVINQRNARGDDSLPRKSDEVDEMEVAPNGALLDGREYICTTFTLPTRGDTLFMLASECAKLLAYRNSKHLFKKNRQLHENIANPEEMNRLIDLQILPSSYRSRQNAIVPARSMFRQFGSRMIANEDEYCKARRRKRGLTDRDLADESRLRAVRPQNTITATAGAGDKAALATLPQTEISNDRGPRGFRSSGRHSLPTTNLPATYQTDDRRYYRFLPPLRPRPEKSESKVKDAQPTAVTRNVVTALHTTAPEFPILPAPFYLQREMVSSSVDASWVERNKRSGESSEGSLDSESWTDSEVLAEWDVPESPQRLMKKAAVAVLVYRFFSLGFNSLRRHAQQRNQTGDAASISLAGLTASQGSTEGNANTRVGKRKQNDEPGDEDGKPPSRRRLNSPNAPGAAPLLACPFYKNDRRQFKECGTKVLRNIPRVKFHLLRCHQEPIYCDRCSETFEDDAAKKAHLRQDVTCMVRPQVQWHAINEHQKKQLAQRISRKKTTSENWYSVYRLLFGDSNRPESPYLDEVESEELRKILTFAECEGPSVVDDLMTDLPESLKLQCDEVQPFLESATQDFIAAVFERWEAEQRAIAAAAATTTCQARPCGQREPSRDAVIRTGPANLDDQDPPHAAYSSFEDAPHLTLVTSESSSSDETAMAQESLQSRASFYTANDLSSFPTPADDTPRRTVTFGWETWGLEDREPSPVLPFPAVQPQPHPAGSNTLAQLFRPGPAVFPSAHDTCSGCLTELVPGRGVSSFWCANCFPS